MIGLSHVLSNAFFPALYSPELTNDDDCYWVWEIDPDFDAQIQHSQGSPTRNTIGWVDYTGKTTGVGQRVTS